MQRISFIILTIFICQACEKTEKVDNFPKHTSKLVTNCFFGPDTCFRFDLYKSLSPIDNAPFKALTSPKAYIRVFENSILFDSLTFNITPPYYAGNRKKRPKAGNTYRFECVYPGFDLVKGEDYLPYVVNIQKMKGFYTILNSYTSTDSSVYGDFKTNLNIDFGQTSPYILVQILSNSLYRYRGMGGYYPGNNYGKNIYGIADHNTANESDYVNNQLFVFNPAGVKTLNLNWDNNYSYLYKRQASYHYDIIIYSCSKASFEYMKRRSLQVENNDDPFSQPTPISNNIQNGYGIFGGVNQYNDSLKF